MIDLINNDDITENPDGIRLKPEITEKRNEKGRKDKRIKISYSIHSN